MSSSLYSGKWEEVEGGEEGGRDDSMVVTVMSFKHRDCRTDIHVV
jgi:hypothetical protein